MTHMWRNKKFIIITLLVLVVLGGTLGGIAIAQANDQGNTTAVAAVTGNNTQLSALLDKIVTIYQQNTGVTLNAQELLKAFQQAIKENRDTALDNYLNSLVSKGKITQDQANQFKTWLESRPDFLNQMMPFGGFRMGPGMMGRGFHGFFGGKNQTQPNGTTS